MAPKKPNIVTRQAAAGEIIFNEGDEADCAYLIKYGSVEIARRRGNDDTVLTVLGPNEVFGDYAFVDDAPRSATARARERCLLVMVPSEVFYKLQNGYDEFTRALFKCMVARIRDLTARADVGARADWV